MKVGFFHIDRPGNEHHVRLAELMVASIRRWMPGVEIVQLTDAILPLALGCLEAYARCDGEWLFLDTDVIVQRDVRHIFDRPFDIAVAEREGTLLDKEVGKKFMARMPFNKGAVFSRSPAFWRAAAVRLRAMKPARQEWMGDQQAMNDVIASGAYHIEVLPARYNYPPKHEHEDVTSQAILHFKGKRKAWMRERAYA